jgi:hypothetical protein
MPHGLPELDNWSDCDFSEVLFEVLKGAFQGRIIYISKDVMTNQKGLPIVRSVKTATYNKPCRQNLLSP